MAEKITLDQEAFKALAADTRIKILKTLQKRRHTQSELAAVLSLSIPTIKEHLSALEKAELVEKKEEGRKWKYFELTPKAKAILLPEEKNIWILLGTLGLTIAGGAIGLFKGAATISKAEFQTVTETITQGAMSKLAAAPMAEESKLAERMVDTTIQTNAGAADNNLFITLLILLVLIQVILLVYFIYKVRKSKKILR